MSTLAADWDRWLGSAHQLRWVPLRELRGEWALSCIDGRHVGCTLGAPGGNAGELVLLLSVLEWYADLRFDHAMVRAILRGQAARLGAFYLHTDVPAVARLAGSLGVSPHEAAALLRAPSPDRREALRAALARPDHVGCGHLRLLLERSVDYRVRPALVESLIVAFHELLWEGVPGLELAVLEGEHLESAALVFHTAERLDEETLVPTWCGRGGAPSAFVTHLPVLRWLRREALAAALGTLPVDPLLRLDPDQVLLEIERLGERHLGLTLASLAPGLPRYRLRFRSAGQRVDVAA